LQHDPPAGRIVVRVWYGNVDEWTMRAPRVCVRDDGASLCRAGFSGYRQLRYSSGPLVAAGGPRVTASATPHQISEFFKVISFRIFALGKGPNNKEFRKW
jgi:hypothetical protein